jgi:hypothetical protein
MKNLLTILFAFALGLNLSAQVSSYLPSDGLVGWYPFNGNANDESVWHGLQFNRIGMSASDFLRLHL